MRGLALAVVSLLLASACTAIVQPGERRVRCEVRGGVDACPAGQRCLDGVCTAVPDGGLGCEAQEVGCNHRDDDCDGRIDEGSDFDGDGYAWCDPDPARRDCRDDNAGIHPGVTEDPPCDGADNDCSGSEAQCPDLEVCHPDGGCRRPDCSFFFLCDPGERCDLDASPPTCVPFEQDCTQPEQECAMGEICDPRRRVCIPPREFGEPCTFDEECVEGARCFEASALGIELPAGTQEFGVCSAPCCSHADCPDGTVCWAPGTGARGCLPPSVAPPAAEAPCGSHDDCPAPQLCRARNSSAGTGTRWATTCAAPDGFSDGFCLANSNCFGNLCLGFGCAEPCRTSADCGRDSYCTPYELSGTENVLQVCLPFAGAHEAAPLGASCTFNGDCRGTGCLHPAQEGMAPYCTDACCTDADCASAGLVCRPFRYVQWSMLCQRP